ncbi:hypothetical protein [Aquimarina algiphila]|uniref:hypothetical protein n=1 Tax=Aquimarina algiphila TaxID=2047982 RepID=UPI002493CA94|nr:hypothetical protein [Aquimarina algiphila]
MDLKVENIGSAVENVALPALGWAGSGAVAALVPEKQKKIVKAALLGGSILIAAATQAGAKVIKPGTKVLSGIAIRQGMDLLQDALRTKYAITDASTSSDKLIAGAIGLACPDGSCGENIIRYEEDYQVDYLPALNMPDYDMPIEEMTLDTNTNTFA